MDLVIYIYKLSNELPENEKYGLVSQIRRCSISIPSNIAEGAARGTTKEFIRFLNITRRSLSELDTQLEIIDRLNYCNNIEEIKEKLTIISKMLFKLISKLKTKIR